VGKALDWLLPWDSQPQEAVGIDWENPLTTALKSAVLVLPGAAYDAVTGAVATPNGFTGTATSGFIPTVDGWGVAFDGTNDYLSFGSYRGGTGATGLTIACRLKLASVALNQRIVVIRVGGVSFQIAGYSSSQIGAFTAGAALGGASPAVGTWVTVFAEFAPTTNAAVGVYIDKGALLSTSLGAGGDTTTAQYIIGSQDGANRFSSATVSRVFVFDRVLSAVERGQIVDAPWQLFAPRSIWVPVSTAGGGASTITAAAGTSTASTLTGASTAATTPTAAAGAATASTVAASSTAASAITSATGAATASTLTGSAFVAGAMTAAAGVATGETLTASSVAAGAITAAVGVATGSTITGTGLTAGASAITPAAGTTTAATMAGASTAAATLTAAAGVATGATLVPAATVVSASMTPAAGTTTAATFAASAVAASVAVAAAGASSAQVMAASSVAAAAITAAAGSSVCGTLANADALIVVLGSLAGSTRKPGAIRSNVQSAVRSNRQTAKR